MPRLKVFRLHTPAGYASWLAWRARVVQHEERELHRPNNWWHGPHGYTVGLEWERKQWFSSEDRRRYLVLPLAQARHYLAIWWADDNYWAILPTLTKET